MSNTDEVKRRERENRCIDEFNMLVSGKNTECVDNERSCPFDDECNGINRKASLIDTQQTCVISVTDERAENRLKEQCSEHNIAFIEEQSNETIFNEMRGLKILNVGLRMPKNKHDIIRLKMKQIGRGEYHTQRLKMQETSADEKNIVNNRKNQMTKANVILTSTKGIRRPMIRYQIY
jgi:hypothetical protein